MKTKIIGLFIIILLIGITIPSLGMINEQMNKAYNLQKSGIEWIKTFGGSKYDFLSSITPTNEGGYLLGGKTYTWSNGIGDVWLIKTDNEGNEIWNTSFGGPGIEGGPDELFSLDDGSFIILTVTNSYGSGDFDFWFVKVDSNGNIILNKTFGGEGMDYIGFGIKYNDEYLFVGQTNSYGAGGFDAWLLKIDSEGNEIWNKTYGGLGDDIGYCIYPTNDSGFILCGEKYTPKEIPWLFKIDTDGNMIWEKTYKPIIGQGRAFRVVQTNDGGYFILSDTNLLFMGNYWLGRGDFGLIKTDDQGNMLWQKIIGKFIFAEQSWGLLQTDDNGFIITGYTKGIGGLFAQSQQIPQYKQACIIKIDANASIEWEEDVGNGICFKPVNINENIFVVGGVNKPGRSWDGVFIKIN